MREGEPPPPIWLPTTMAQQRERAAGERKWSRERCGREGIREMEHLLLLRERDSCERGRPASVA
uniref:Uncharacterized protein n=1 Tax=Arundo donax TaxID=35708 RepID=A0A0A9BU71_ARUDO